jgi:hypothetical protein
VLHVTSIEDGCAAARERGEPLNRKRPVGKKRTTKPAARPITADRRTAADRALAERMLERLRGGADLRARQVRRIKAAIKVRHYENALKLAVAVDRMTGAVKRLRS